MGAIRTKRGGLDEEIEDRREYLAVADRVVHMDWRQMWVGEDERGMEAFDMRVVVRGRTAIVCEGEATVIKMLVSNLDTRCRRRMTYWSPVKTIRVSFAIPVSSRTSKMSFIHLSWKRMVLRYRLRRAFPPYHVRFINSKCLPLGMPHA